MLALNQPRQVRQALKGLQEFIAEDELGLYRGEALKIVAMLALEELEIQTAEKWLEKLDIWIANARKDSSDWDFQDVLPGIRAAAKKVTDAPKEEKFTDYWGKVKKQPIPHGSLVNRKTCPWYLDDLEEYCAKYKGLVHIITGDLDSAKEMFERLLQLDPAIAKAQQSGLPNDYSRLMFGATEGYLIAYPQELELYSKRHQAAIMLADFYYVTCDWDRAEAQYQRILDSHYGRLSVSQRGYPQFALGSVAYWKGNRTQAIVLMKKVVSEQRVATFTQSRAAYAVGNILGNGGSKEHREEAILWWESLVKSDLRNEYTAKAHISLAIKHYEAGDTDKALAILTDVTGHGQSWEDIANFYIQEFKK